MDKNMQELSNKCVETHAVDDIWTHLEEECLELLLAICRAKRKKEPFIHVVEELTDVKIEVNTVMTLIDKMIDRKEMLSDMLEKKLTKFESALHDDGTSCFSNTLIDRYVPMSQIMKERNDGIL